MSAWSGPRRRRREGMEGLVAIARRHGVADERLLHALARTPRDRYVPPHAVDEAWGDHPVPLPHSQTTSQPSLIAAMVAELTLQPDDAALEIGTGYGFQTALMARLCRFVVSVERWPSLAEAARDNLASDGVANVEIVVGDGTKGVPEHAPYQGIVVAAAGPEVPPALAEQLDEGGRLVMPVGPRGTTMVTRFLKRDGELVEARRMVPARFVDLVSDED